MIKRSAAALVTLSLIACSGATPDGGDSVGASKQAIELKRGARKYRHYRAAPSAKGAVVVTRDVFEGLVMLPDVSADFSTKKGLVRDAHGNLATGWRQQKDGIRSVVRSPKGVSTNVVGIGDDGAISSSVDLDGDGVAEVVDVLTPEGVRHVFVDEALGLDVFGAWLRGQNPLCRDPILKGLQAQGAFGCPEGGSDEGGLGGGPLGELGGRGTLDPFDVLCAGRVSKGPRLDLPVMAHGPHGYGSEYTWGIVSNPNDASDRAVYTREWRDTEGNLVSITRIITETFSDGTERTTTEQISHDGSGRRTVVDHGTDGTTKTHREDITATITDEGDVTGTEPPAFEGDEPRPTDGSGDVPPEPVEPVDTETSTPGPYGPEPDPEQALNEWCQRRAEDHRSGAERAGDIDLGDTSMDCDDPVTNPAASGGDGRDCGVSRAERIDVGDAFAGAASTCGPYEQPGPDGTCGAGSALSRLRGGAAWIGQADFEGLPICDPIVCNPGL